MRTTADENRQLGEKLAEKVNKSTGPCIFMLPLKEIRPYVVMVDRQTGESELVVSTRPADLAETDAVRQAELVRYVSERETYDTADNRERIPAVLATSQGQAATSLRALWTKEADQYPPAIYGEDSLIKVKVRSVAILNDATAQAIARAERPTTALALLLVSPDFLRR